jgi:hypothetical protein
MKNLFKTTRKSLKYKNFSSKKKAQPGLIPTQSVDSINPNDDSFSDILSSIFPESTIRNSYLENILTSNKKSLKRSPAKPLPKPRSKAKKPTFQITPSITELNLSEISLSSV